MVFCGLNNFSKDNGIVLRKSSPLANFFIKIKKIIQVTPV
jgi:hypothetical protein